VCSSDLVELSNTGGRRSQQIDAFTRAYNHRDRLTDRERYLTQAAYESYVDGDRDRAITAYRSLLDLDPNDPYALNNLSEALIEIGNFTQAVELSRRAIRTSPDGALYYLVLTAAQVGLGQIDSAEANLRLLQRRVPRDPFVGLLAGTFLALRGDYDSGQSVVRRTQEARRESPSWQTTTNSLLASLAVTEGRLAQADGYLQAAVHASDAQGLPERALVYELARAAIDLWYRGQPGQARQKMDAAVQRAQLGRLDPADRPYLWLAVLYAEAGRPDRARAYLAEYNRLMPEGLRRIDVVQRHAAAGSIALAERRPQDAISEFHQQDQGACVLCTLAGLGRAYDEAGQTDSAVAMYERYLGTPDIFRVYLDAVWLARTYYRLGEIYETRGERAKAADYYAKFVRLWKDADPELRPKVMDAKSRLKALTGEHSTT